ncbi:MAG: VWA domain-containing protein [Acidobacteria bacterium]|nr:VWA domain-containing protein [Acidobacteriota bacterium]
MKRSSIVVLAFVAAACAASWYVLAGSPAPAASAHQGPGAGELVILAPDGSPAGFCPLEHTSVRAEISGFLSRVTLTQRFGNNSSGPVEAVYVFPLPDSAAVDRMTMKVGDRTVLGKVKRREEARAIYEAARNAGKAASLLDQERPNIFTQSVANIMPGETIDITISYVEILAYDDGTYSFVFPMVVGPRYIPGQPAGKAGGGWAADTDQVTDASKITPPVAVPGTRAGHDISLEVVIDAGVPILDVSSALHDVDIQRTSNRSATVALKSKNALPNKDFVLKYSVAGGKIADAVLSHRNGGEGFVTMILQPPGRIAAEDVTSRELVFVVDTSGSMSGFPLEKAKETMNLAFEALRPDDTFNLITFSGDTAVLFPEPVPASAGNLAKARSFLDGRRAGGGTEMMAAIRTALDPSDRQNHVRIVCFMTDGYVGNEAAILAEIQRHPNARVFSFGIGNSVNRFLLDRMAVEGRGEVEYVSLSDDGSAAARRFAERVQNPLLTDISIDWGGLQVVDAYPSRVLDLFSAKPMVVVARYTSPGRGTVRIRGKQAGSEIVREVAVDLPAVEKSHDTLRALWARQKIEDLERQDYSGTRDGNPRADIQAAITELGLKYGLMTRFTSFVAVEEMVINRGGEIRRVEVPVEMPEGVAYDGVFGDEGVDAKRKLHAGRGQAGGFGSGAISTNRAPRSKAPLSARPVEQESAGDKSSSDGPVPLRDPEPGHRAKLDSVLKAMVDASRSGTVDVQIFFSDLSPATRKELSKLGVEILFEPRSGRILIARVQVARLELLAKLSSVSYIAEYRD